MVENLPAIQETQFQSLGWEMVTQSCSLALENSMDSGSWLKNPEKTVTLNLEFDLYAKLLASAKL